MHRAVKKKFGTKFLEHDNISLALGKTCYVDLLLSEKDIGEITDLNYLNIASDNNFLFVLIWKMSVLNGCLYTLS